MIDELMVQEQDFEFLRHDHSYMVDDGKRRVLSVTQVLKFAGLISYEGIPQGILQNAAWRGTLVHEVTAKWDAGEDVEALYDIPPEIYRRFCAWTLFCKECSFVPDPTQIERARVVTVGGYEYGMTPDVVGWLDGIPTVVDRKNTAAAHPSWAIQLAAYEAGLPRPEGYRNYKRVAVQLMDNGKYKAHPFNDPSDFAMFQHSYSVAAWKINNRLVKLA